MCARVVMSSRVQWKVNKAQRRWEREAEEMEDLHFS